MYYLVCNGEIIEDDIKTKEEAKYLQGEYRLAFNSLVLIKKKRS